MSLTVKAARVIAGYTQDDMAEKMGIHVQTYRKIENNPEQATIEQGLHISRITGINFDEIFFSNNSTKSRKSKKGTPHVQITKTNIKRTPSN